MIPSGQSVRLWARPDCRPMVRAMVRTGRLGSLRENGSDSTKTSSKKTVFCLLLAFPPATIRVGNYVPSYPIIRYMGLETATSKWDYKRYPVPHIRYSKSEPLGSAARGILGCPGAVLMSLALSLGIVVMLGIAISRHHPLWCSWYHTRL